MAKFSAAPRANYLTYVLRIFSYLKTHDRSRLVFDHKKRDWSHRNFTDYDWQDQYPGKEDESPPGMPEALGKSVQINFFCDAAHAQDLLSQQEIADRNLDICEWITYQMVLEEAEHSQGISLWVRVHCPKDCWKND